MNSEQCVRRMSFLDKENSQVFFEGFLGELKNVTMVEELMLEITGANGVLRIDITQRELEKYLETKKAATLRGDQ
jgi:hypothetical protein